MQCELSQTMSEPDAQPVRCTAAYDSGGTGRAEEQERTGEPNQKITRRSQGQ